MSQHKKRISDSTIHESNIYVIGNRNTIYGTNVRIIGNYNKLFGGNSRVRGNHNKIYGDDNEIIGNWNEVIDGKDNRLEGNWNKAPTGCTIVRKKSRKRKKRRILSQIDKPPTKRRRLSVSHGTLIQTCGDVCGGIGNFISFPIPRISGITRIFTNSMSSIPIVMPGMTVNMTNIPKILEVPTAEKETSAPDDTPNTMLCKICMENYHNTLIIDCSHACLCVTCSIKLLEQKKVRCPICRQYIVKGIRRIYS